MSGKGFKAQKVRVHEYMPLTSGGVQVTGQTLNNMPQWARCFPLAVVVLCITCGCLPKRMQKVYSLA